MLLDLKTVTSEPRDIVFSVGADWWPSGSGNDSILGFDTPLQVKVRIYRAGDKYVLEGGFSGGLQLPCDRCLEPYHRDLKSRFKVFLSLPLPPTGEIEVELYEGDLEVDFIRGEEIELDEIIKEQIFLTLPIKSLCRENCSGLCPTCGCSLNREECHCLEGKGHPGFQRLKDLMSM